MTKRTGLQVEVADEIRLAIVEAVRAGVYRKAARLNPRTAKTWEGFAELHSERLQALLGEMLNRLGV